MVPAGDTGGDGDVDEAVVALADQHLRLAGHGGVDGVGSKSGAVDRIVAVSRDTADDVGRVDVLDVADDAFFLEVGLDLVLEIQADIMELHVSGSVMLGGRRQQLLPRALGDQDHRMVAGKDAGLQVVQQTIGSVHVERVLGNQAEVDVALGQGSLGGDETALASHDLDDTDTIDRTLRLGMGASDGRHRLGDRSVHTKRGLHIQQVVVDGLGHTDHGDLQATATDFVSDVAGTPERAVTTDGDQDVDVQPLQRIDNLVDLLAAATGVAQNRAALFLDLVHHVRSQVDQRPRGILEKTLVAVLDAADTTHAVAVPETTDNRPDDVVQTRTDTAAGTNGGMDMARVEVDLLPRTGDLEQVLLFALDLPFHDPAVKRIDDPVVVVDVIGSPVSPVQAHGNRAGDFRLAQILNGEINFLSSHFVLLLLHEAARLPASESVHMVPAWPPSPRAGSYRSTP